MEGLSGLLVLLLAGALVDEWAEALVTVFDLQMPKDLLSGRVLALVLVGTLQWAVVKVRGVATLLVTAL